MNTLIGGQRAEKFENHWFNQWHAQPVTGK